MGKIVTENRMNSNVKSDSDLIATNRSVAKAVLAIHVIIAELANKKLRPTDIHLRQIAQM